MNKQTYFFGPFGKVTIWDEPKISEIVTGVETSVVGESMHFRFKEINQLDANSFVIEESKPWKEKGCVLCTYFGSKRILSVYATYHKHPEKQMIITEGSKIMIEGELFFKALRIVLWRSKEDCPGDVLFIHN